MRLELTGRHVDITPALRAAVNAKLARLERLLKDAAVSAQVVLAHERHRRRADVTLHARGEKFLHGVGGGATWEASMTVAVDKIVQQAQRVKGKWQERKRQGSKTGALEAGAPRVASGPASAGQPRAPKVRLRMPRTFRTLRQTLKAMSVADAAREVEANGEDIVVFRDTETAAVSVVYRRSNGELTLVETES